MADRRCIICIDFITSDREAMKRHVAIIHGQSTFSTLQCSGCNRKYYDMNHFRDHIRESPTCPSEFSSIKTVQLSQDVERRFISLVDQMMEPVQVQSGSSIGGQSSATETTAINRESAPSENLTSSSVDRPSANLKMEGNDNEIPKIILVTSLAHERSNINQSSTMECEIPVAMDSTEETDTQQHVADENFMEHEDGLDILNREAARSPGQSTNQVPTADGNDGEQKQTSCKPTKDNLRHYCLEMIVKYQQEERLICLLCQKSIGIFSNGNPQYLYALDHAASHLPPIFKCVNCEFKSHAYLIMWMHMNDQHSESVNQSIELTSDWIDELMELVSQCFDHGFQVGNSSEHQQEIKTSPDTIGENMATPNSYYVSSSNFGSSTMPKSMFKTNIAADSEKKSEMPLACAPLLALHRYYERFPDHNVRPIVPEMTFQYPTSNIPSAAATAAKSSIMKRIPSIIAQPFSTFPAVSGFMTSGSQSPITSPASIFFPANVVVRSSGTTSASSHISDGDDESMSVGQESMSSETLMIHEEGGGSETAPLNKIVSPTGSSEERRFFCTAFGCKKNYKKLKHIRRHIKNVHNAGTAKRQPRQPNAKNFRCECGIEYKTTHGLHNHMVKTKHRQAPIPSLNPSMGNKNAPGGANSNNAVVIVSARASQFKRISSITSMAGVTSTQTDNVSGSGLKQERRGPQSSLNSAYYPQPPNLKSGSSTTTLPSGVSFQVSNLGGGATSGGPVGPGPVGAQNLHISAGRRLSAANQMQQHQMNPIGGRPLKIHSGVGSGAGVNIQGVVVSTPSAPGVNADSSSSSLTSVMDSAVEANKCFVCDKCGFTTAFKNRLVSHQKILHAE